jgi:hypothetical protein
MAIKGRTQLSIHITDEHHDIFNQIKEETGLSNAKIVEMLIDSYVSSPKTTSTTIKPTKTTSTKSKPEQPEPKYVTEERVKELIQEALFSSQSTQTRYSISIFRVLCTNHTTSYLRITDILPRNGGNI